MTSLQPHAPTTDWTVISQARQLPYDHEYRKACLEKMFHRYRAPVMHMMRAWGLRNEHDLDDAVQDFFLKFLEKNWLNLLSRERGSFRGFLRVSIHHFLLDRRERMKARLVITALPDDDLIAGTAPMPEEILDQAWAWNLLTEVIEELRRKCDDSNMKHYWIVFERHVLGADNPEITFKDTAILLHTGEKEISNYLYRVRKLFSKLIYEAVSHTINGDNTDVKAEILHLRNSLRRRYLPY